MLKVWRAERDTLTAERGKRNREYTVLKTKVAEAEALTRDMRRPDKEERGIRAVPGEASSRPANFMLKILAFLDVRQYT